MKFDLCPIFDSFEHFSKLPLGLTMLNEYPDTKLFIENLKPELPSIIDDIIQSQSNTFQDYHSGSGLSLIHI